MMAPPRPLPVSPPPGTPDLVRWGFPQTLCPNILRLRRYQIEMAEDFSDDTDIVPPLGTGEDLSDDLDWLCWIANNAIPRFCPCPEHVEARAQRRAARK